MAKIIRFKRTKRSDRFIHIKLPNDVEFTAHEEDMAGLFENPMTMLRDSEKEGMIMLALAIVFADFRKKSATR